MSPRIVLVGHCGPDCYALRSAIMNVLPGASVEFVNDEDGTLKAAAGGGLFLVNRLLEGDFSGDGLGLIARLVAVTKVMLVSNYPDAQAASERLGGLPGFGKKALYAEETRRRLQAAVG